MFFRERKDRLESLIKWTYAAPRDLPFFYELSLGWALKSGKPPHQAHSKDCMLHPSIGMIAFTKRIANSAICRMSEDAVYHPDPELNVKDQKDEAVHHFIAIYKSFRRLNCPIEDTIWQSRSMRNRLLSASIVEADALCNMFQHVYVNVDDQVPVRQMTWEAKLMILQKATTKGENMITSLETADNDGNKRERKKRKILDM